MKNYSIIDDGSNSTLINDLRIRVRTLLEWRLYYFPKATTLDINSQSIVDSTKPWESLAFRQKIILNEKLNYNNIELPVGTQIINNFRPSTNGADCSANPSRTDFTHYLVIEPPVGTIYVQNFRQNSDGTIDFIWSAVLDKNNNLTSSENEFVFLSGELPRYCNLRTELILKESNINIAVGKILLDSSSSKRLFNPKSGDYWPPVVPQLITRYNKGTQEDFVTDYTINFNNEDLTGSSSESLSSSVSFNTQVADFLGHFGAGDILINII